MKSSAIAQRDITRLLALWRLGDQEALPELMSTVYAELRQLAASHLRRERWGHTLETRDLVHEAFLRLSAQRGVRWKSRRHFFATASHMMRRVLVDHARRQPRSHRGAPLRKLPLDQVPHLASERSSELLALDDALHRLGEVYAQQAQVVELRVFGGCTSAEVAEVLGISIPTVTRRWRMARAWLLRHLDRGDGDGR